ncbi:hypothetical protein GI584_08160 [Gracilibacillus salitolerans]|uniref:Uncharacterized protein n=1 Tax=Gracilibacillus salitolerans TaxID=2663022 RepID=A0A5Q2TL53_9BACI|nr:hypothetical protein [Gracilibacillus salitolerans]QGH33998.1 hypothetical protein GI584_08160 [Gracilibacillus salitolerans]
MKEKRKENFQMPNPANQDGEIGIRKDIDPAHLEDTVERYAGDSVDAHKELEEANEYVANKEIEQVRNNS